MGVETHGAPVPGWETVVFPRGLMGFLAGDLSRRTLFALVLPAASVAYFGSLALAILLLPVSLDWRSTTISKLVLYPQNNPGHSWVARVGIALAAGLIVPFAGYIGARLRWAAPLGSRAGTWIFRLGAASAFLVGATGYHGNSRFPRLHTLLSREAAFALFAGVIVFSACALKGCLGSTEGSRRCGPFLIALWGVLALSGPSAVLLSALETSGRSHRFAGIYEWAASVVFFLFLLSSALLPPKGDLQTACPPRE
jgi:hypothetical protein